MRLQDRGLLSEVRSLHDEMVVVNGLDASSFNERLIPNMQSGGVDVNVVGGMNWQLVRRRSDELVQGTSVRAIQEGVADGKIAIVFGAQSPGQLRGDVRNVPDAQMRGLRSCGIAYNVQNDMGSGCVDPDPGGLSHLGVRLVEALEANGIVVDIGGHCSEATSFDAITIATKPVVCTHTNVRALRNTPRGTTDELFRAIADTGGCAGITSFRFFVAAPDQPATVREYVDHIDYVRRLVGPDHVGLGFDFIFMRYELSGNPSPITFPPSAYPPRREDWDYVDDLADHSGVPLVTAELVRRGYPREDIEKIMGLNWLRVWKEVWGE